MFETYIIPSFIVGVIFFVGGLSGAMAAENKRLKTLWVRIMTSGYLFAFPVVAQVLLRVLGDPNILQPSLGDQLLAIVAYAPIAGLIFASVSFFRLFKFLKAFKHSETS